MAVSQAGFNGSSGYCAYGSIATSANVGPVVLAVNHTFLLLATAWRRLQTSRRPDSDVEAAKASAPSEGGKLLLGALEGICAERSSVLFVSQSIWKT